MEVSSVNSIESVVVSKIGAKHLDRDNVVHVHASLFDDLLDLVHRQASFFFGTDGLVRRVRVNTSCARNVKRVTRYYAAAERQISFSGQFRRQVLSGGGLAGQLRPRQRRYGEQEQHYTYSHITSGVNDLCDAEHFTTGQARHQNDRWREG